MAHEENQRFDVVVVGCGVAGLSAAVAAAEAGEKVAVLERSTFEERGGNTRYTTAAIRMKSEEAVSDDFLDVFASNSGYHVQPDFIAATVLDHANRPPQVRAASFTDPDLISFFADEAPPAIAWLKAHGVKFGGIGFYGLTPRASPRIAISGGGLHLIEVMTAHAEKIGVTFFYETTARRLLQAENGDICGLSVMARAGGGRTIDCGAVILACGGFQGNAEMMNRYIGPRAIYLKMMSVGCHYNKGEGIRMALDIGAASCGDFGSWHASPFDPRSKRAGASIYIYPYGILVNKHGRRFVNEAPGHTDATYEGVTREIFAQPQGIAWTIIDAKANEVPNQSVAIRTEQPAIESPTIEGLADKLGIPPEILRATVDEYNRACQPGAFDPRKLDHLATRGVTPAKSHWSRPIDTGPFRAYPIVSSIVFTFGGLKTDSLARVINLQGDPIPGLYAAGETQGLYYGTYTGATSVLKGAVFGRVAGQDAAALTRVQAGAH